MRMNAVKTEVRSRILIADQDQHFARRLADYLIRHGYEVRMVGTVNDARINIEVWRPDTIFVDFMLPPTNAGTILKFLNVHNMIESSRVVVMSKQAKPEAIAQLRRAGASAYLVKPFAMDQVFKAMHADIEPVRKAQPPIRVEAHTILKPGQVESTGPIEMMPISRLAEILPAEQGKELHLMGLFLRQATSEQGSKSLYNLMRMMNIKIKALRCSLVQCLNSETGIVLASNDDESVTELPIHLTHYPEILAVGHSLNPLVIPNVRTSNLLAPVRGRLDSLPYESMAIFPVFKQGRFFGVINVRTSQKNPGEIFYMEKFGQVCAQIISLTIPTQVASGPRSL